MRVVVFFPSPLYNHKNRAEIPKILVSFKEILFLHLKLMMNYKCRTYNEERPPNPFCFD